MGVGWPALFVDFLEKSDEGKIQGRDLTSKTAMEAFKIHGHLDTVDENKQKNVFRKLREEKVK